jgi:uncharacterized protein YbjQ (UPF0145 family)
VAGRKLTDDEALRRLEQASRILGDEACVTVRAQTALTTARAAVSILMLGLEAAAEDGADEVPGVLKPEA